MQLQVQHTLLRDQCVMHKTRRLPFTYAQLAYAFYLSCSNRQQFVIAVTCCSGRLQCHDIIKRLLVTHLSNTLFNFYCQFFTFAKLNSLENVTNHIPLRLSVILSLVFNYFQKQMHLYYTVNKHSFDGNLLKSAFFNK